MKDFIKSEYAKERIRKFKLMEIITGLIAGFINGVFGGGGGMVVVPMLTGLLKKETKTAHATAILIILPISLFSTILYAYNGSLNGAVFLPVGIGVTVGGIIGALLLSKLSSKFIVWAFAFEMAFAGFKMLLF